MVCIMSRTPEAGQGRPTRQERQFDRSIAPAENRACRERPVKEVIETIEERADFYGQTGRRMIEEKRRLEAKLNLSVDERRLLERLKLTSAYLAHKITGLNEALEILDGREVQHMPAGPAEWMGEVIEVFSPNAKNGQ